MQWCGAARFLERLRLQVLSLATAAPAPAPAPAPATYKASEFKKKFTVLIKKALFVYNFDITSKSSANNKY